MRDCNTSRPTTAPTTICVINQGGRPRGTEESLRQARGISFEMNTGVSLAFAWRTTLFQHRPARATTSGVQRPPRRNGGGRSVADDAAGSA